MTEINKDAPPAHPTQKPKQTEVWEGEGGALPEVREIPMPLPATPLTNDDDEQLKNKKSLEVNQRTQT